MRNFLKNDQDYKRRLLKKNLLNKKGQEEIVGFVIIIVIVSVVILVLLSFMLTKKENIATDSYEIESFIQSMLQYTTECEINSEILSLNRLISLCNSKGICTNGEGSCVVLENTLKEILNSAWVVNENSVVKGYDFKIVNDNKEIFSMMEGNKTARYKGSYQDFVRSGEKYQVVLTIYEE
jgi:hypothetical protein